MGNIASIASNSGALYEIVEIPDEIHDMEWPMEHFTDKSPTEFFEDRDARQMDLYDAIYKTLYEKEVTHEELDSDTYDYLFKICFIAEHVFDYMQDNEIGQISLSLASTKLENQFFTAFTQYLIDYYSLSAVPSQDGLYLNITKELENSLSKV